MNSVSILPANINPPGIICVESRPGIPRIIAHFSAVMYVARHHQVAFFGKINECKCFRLMLVSIRMRTIFGIRIIAVKINAICIAACCSVNRIIPPGISAIRICQRIYPDIYIVNKICNSVVTSVIFQ